MSAPAGADRPGRVARRIAEGFAASDLEAGDAPRARQRFVVVEEEFPNTINGESCPVRIVAVEEARIAAGERRLPILGPGRDWRGRLRKRRLP